MQREQTAKSSILFYEQERTKLKCYPVCYDNLDFTEDTDARIGDDPKSCSVERTSRYLLDTSPACRFKLCMRDSTQPPI